MLLIRANKELHSLFKIKKSGNISIIYLAYKDELDKIIRQEVRYKSKAAELIQEKIQLEKKIKKDKARLTELEEFYTEYREARQPFDLNKAGISSENIELIRLIVSCDTSYSEVAEKLKKTPTSIKQRIYRINNKIGIDSLEELKQLCQFNWPESAGKY